MMEDFYKRGVLKAIGVSNYEVRHLEEVMSNSATVPHVNQIEIHPHFQNRCVAGFICQIQEYRLKFAKMIQCPNKIR